MWLALALLSVLATLGLILVASYERWQQITQREGFFLRMKEASRPGNMLPEERSRLKLLRSPWWAVWRWVPYLWRRTPMS